MALLRVIFEGGVWDGRVDQIDANGSGFAERWAKDEDETHVYKRSETVKPAVFEHDTREGKKLTTEQATVFELVERRPLQPLRAAATARARERREARLAAGEQSVEKHRGESAEKPAKATGKSKKRVGQSELF
jgi:hypothetical protein